MNNKDKVLEFRIELLYKGLIKSTGRKIIFKDEEVFEPEEMHTKVKWKLYGKTIRPGENGHPLIIWIPRKDGSFYKKTITFYAESQTD